MADRSSRHNLHPEKAPHAFQKMLESGTPFSNSRTHALLYAAVQAGICAAQGPRHGAFTNRVESFLTDMAHRQDLEDAVLHRLRNGDPVPGFGHPLYPDGDPRAVTLLRMMKESHGDDPAFLRSQRILDVMEDAGGLKPSIDFAIGALGATLRMLPGAGLSVFVLGRTAGWIGHAIEQYRSGQMIRPSALCRRKSAMKGRNAPPGAMTGRSAPCAARQNE